MRSPVAEQTFSERFKWFPFGYPFCSIDEHRWKQKLKLQKKPKRKKGNKHRNPK